MLVYLGINLVTKVRLAGGFEQVKEEPTPAEAQADL